MIILYLLTLLPFYFFFHLHNFDVSLHFNSTFNKKNSLPLKKKICPWCKSTGTTLSLTIRNSKNWNYKTRNYNFRNSKNLVIYIYLSIYFIVIHIALCLSTYKSKCTQYKYFLFLMNVYLLYDFMPFCNSKFYIRYI